MLANRHEADSAARGIGRLLKGAANMSRGPVFLLLVNVALSGAGSPDLLTAIRNGDHSTAQKLLAAAVDVNSADADGTTALMHAVIESDVKMMTLLLEKGASVNATNASGSTALMYAATDPAKTRLLLARGADVKVRNKRGATPMSVAVTAFGSTPVLTLLAAKGAEAEDRLMAPAAAKGDLEAIRFLLGLGVSAGDRTGATVSAAITGRCEPCVRLLIEQGAPADAVRPNGGSLLNDTVKRAMPDLSQFLFERGASLQSSDREGFTLLQQAVLSMERGESRDRMIEWLLSKGVDPNARNDRGDTAYQLAARVGIESTLQLLVKAGAKPIKEE